MKELHHSFFETKRGREPYLQVFLLGFAVLLLTILPVMILTGGYFIYYGDFNSQQIPFYSLAHEAVREGAFGWSWVTDLGANFIGSYSFYLLGSPFFWLTIPFPQDAVPYMIPYLLAMKHGLATLTSYAFLRRFVRSKPAAVIGGLLYAFSGFQIFNIFFNHFQDVTAFFPLLLLALEQTVNENRRGIFAVTVGFMAILNYYFFTGQAVFVLLYFLLRCPAEDFQASLKKFFRVALEAVIGVLLAAFLLLPSALAIIENERTQERLYGLDLVTYSDRTRIWHIIQSFFMLPDAPARPNLFRTDYGKWASIGGYLPMFSMAGVIAFMSQRRKHWATRLTAVCLVCMVIPVLNSMFYLFNGSYYARWFYMPILIMALMTAVALDDIDIRWRGGILTCMGFFLACAVISILPRRDENGKTVWFDFAQYPWYVWLTIAVCALLLGVLAFLLRQRSRGKPILKPALWLTAVSSAVSTALMVYFGIALGMYPVFYVNYAIRGGEEITLEKEQNQFYRVDISEDYDNYPMLWGYSNMRCFHSIVPVSIMDFYDEMGVTRDVASRADLSHYPLRALFNVKYYFDRAYPDKAETYSYTLSMPGFRYLKQENSFYIYENEAYIPMGVAYDTYMNTEQLSKQGKTAKEQILLRALGLDSEQIARYSDILHPVSGEDCTVMSDAQYVAYCKERAKETCDTFTYDSYGFTGTIHLSAPKMVFFSVPYEQGWSAEVNGAEVPVERVSYGFMAVRCEEGDNVIEFHYRTPGLKTGAFLSLGGLGLLILYLLLSRPRGRRPEQAPRKVTRDYVPLEPIPLHALYLRHAANKRQIPEPETPDAPEAEEPSKDPPKQKEE